MYSPLRSIAMCGIIVFVVRNGLEAFEFNAYIFRIWKQFYRTHTYLYLVSHYNCYCRIHIFECYTCFVFSGSITLAKQECNEYTLKKMSLRLRHQYQVLPSFELKNTSELDFHFVWLNFSHLLLSLFFHFCLQKKTTWNSSTQTIESSWVSSFIRQQEIRIVIIVKSKTLNLRWAIDLSYF